MRVSRRYLQKVIRQRAGAEWEESVDLLNIVVSAIAEQLCVGNEVEIRDFGVFSVVRVRKQFHHFKLRRRMGTGEVAVVRFHPGKGLKKKVRALLKTFPPSPPPPPPPSSSPGNTGT